MSDVPDEGSRSVSPETLPTAINPPSEVSSDALTELWSPADAPMLSAFPVVDDHANVAVGELVIAIREVRAMALSKRIVRRCDDR